MVSDGFSSPNGDRGAPVAAARTALEARGYHLVNQGWNGDIEAIVVRESGADAVADPRGRGVARVISPAATPDTTGSKKGPGR